MASLRSPSASWSHPVTAPVPPTILVFDSGLGGLTVFRELIKVRPDARFIYVADDAVFPYGAIEEATLVARILTVMGCLIEAHSPDLVVMACNTASTIALSSLRDRFSVPFVGTVPAIKPACAVSVTKGISVLGTKATVKHEYTQGLIREFAAGCEVALVGSARLATLAETELGGRRTRIARSPPSLPHASSMAKNALIRSFSPVPTIPCCSIASCCLPPGRSTLSTRLPRSQGASSIFSVTRGLANRFRPERFSRPGGDSHQPWRRRLDALD
jgi:hypothetical protein